MQLSFRNITAAYVLLLLLLKMMALPVICLQFELNKEFIAANLCENRFKPQLQCKGTCLLEKQLARTVEIPDSQEQKAGSKVISIDYFEDIEPLSFEYVAQHAVHITSSNKDLYATGYIGSIFHPPAA